jgi:hypothetical protein
MIDTSIFTAIVATLILVVFIRIALTLKDIAEALSRMAGGAPTQVQVNVAAPVQEAAKAEEEKIDETEIAAVIAVAKAAMEGTLRQDASGRVA